MESRSDRHTVQPVFRLPPELLSHTFGFILAGIQYSRTHSIELTRLRLVCNKWNATIENTPSLWSTVIVDYASYLPYVENALSRSGSHPLDIRIESSARGIPDETLRTCAEHTARCRALTVNVMKGDMKPPLSYLLTAPSPLLSLLHLVVDSDSGGTDHDLINLFGGHVPTRLEHITLKGRSFRWGWPALTSLITLKLTSMTAAIEQLLNTLTGSLALEYLSLSFVRLSGSLDPLIRAELPSLRTLHALEVGEKAVRCLLGSIYAPSCTRLKIETLSPQDEQPQGPIVSDYLVEKADVIFPRMFPITTSLSFCSWYADGWRYRLERSEGIDNAGSNEEHLAEEMEFYLDILSSDQPWTFLYDFHERYTENVPLSVDAKYSQFFPKTNLFFQLATVTDLTISSYFPTEFEDMLLDYLARPHIVDSSPAWLLPKLKLLRFRRPSNTSMLVHLIKQRYVDMQAGINPPERLHQLILGMRSMPNHRREGFQAALQPIKGWLGNDVLVFDFDHWY